LSRKFSEVHLVFMVPYESYTVGSSAFGIEFAYVHADLEFEGRLLRDVAVRYKGNGTFLESRDSLKRSLKIDLNKYVKNQGLGDVRMLTLQNNVTDASLMNEVLAYRLYRDAGVPGGPGLGVMFSRPWLQVLDEDKNSSVTESEFTRGFARLSIGRRNSPASWTE
jgi:hypothetical protein